jgi:hypothetical protein
MVCCFSYLCETFERLITEDSLPKLYHDSVILISILAVSLIFRGPISALIGRMKRHSSSWFGESEFDTLPVPQPKPQPTALAKESETSGTTIAAAPGLEPTVEEYKIGHYYWLGSDLMEAVHNVAASPNKVEFMRALSQALRHYRKSGLSDKGIEQKLAWLVDLNGKTVQSDWVSDRHRRDMLTELVGVRSAVKTLIDQEAGPRFKPWVD